MTAIEGPSPKGSVRTVALDRLAWVDSGRGIAITLVALFHSTNWIAGTGLPVLGWSDANAVLSSLRMPMFFVLAGLFAAKWLAAKWRDLFRAKVLLFGWVLVVWTVIGMVVQISGRLSAGQEINYRAAVRNVLLCLVNPPFELWFIWALAIFFLAAKLTRAVPPTAQLAVAGAVSAVALTVWLTTTTTMGPIGSAKYYFFFLAGIYARRIILGFASSALWVRLGVFAVWALVSVTLFAWGARGLPGAYFINCVIGVFAGVALATWLSRCGPLRSLGQHTLPVYLAHTPVAILISIVILLVPGLVTVLTPVSSLVPPVVAVIAIALALLLNRATAGSWLRFLYRPPGFVVRLLDERSRGQLPGSR